jgi:hypothetical protein
VSRRISTTVRKRPRSDFKQGQLAVIIDDCDIHKSGTLCKVVFDTVGVGTIIQMTTNLDLEFFEGMNTKNMKDRNELFLIPISRLLFFE